MSRRWVPCVFYRGGSSKGLFFDGRELLPFLKPETISLPLTNRSCQSLNSFLVACMGSPDADYGRQLNGLGGGVSSLSKVAIVSPVEHLIDQSLSESVEQEVRSRCDVDFTFAQIDIGTASVDWGANCGNISSAVGAFAVDYLGVEPEIVVSEEQLSAGHGPHGSSPAIVTGVVRIFNTNTGKEVEARILLTRILSEDTEGFGDGTTTHQYRSLDIEDLAMLGGSINSRLLSGFLVSLDGVNGRDPPVELSYKNPSGAQTGKLLPMSNSEVLSSIEVAGISMQYSVVDASCCVIWVGCGLDTELWRKWFAQESCGEKAVKNSFLAADTLNERKDLLSFLEEARTQIAIKFLPHLFAAGRKVSPQLPRIALVLPSVETMGELTGTGGGSDGSSQMRPPNLSKEVHVRALSMGKFHKAIMGTAALNCAVAAGIPGTIVERAAGAASAEGGKNMEPTTCVSGVVRITTEDVLIVHHASGKIRVSAEWPSDGGTPLSVGMQRSCRLLMEGKVPWRTTVG